MNRCLEQENVAAIIVTFLPDLDHLDDLLKSIACQVGAIIIVDNGSPPGVAELIRGYGIRDIQYLPLGHNSGVAHAHNVGIEKARDIGATHVILFDQDSLPAADMVSKLLDAERTLLSKNIKVGALGPSFYDTRDGFHYPFVRIKSGRLERIYESDVDGVCFADYLITSGCLIRLDVLGQVGGLRDDLFIDYVDVEWGLRLRSHGLCNIGVFGARMEHLLGDKAYVLSGLWRIPMHAPLRHYYHFRNAILLYRSSAIPFQWKLVDGRRLFLRYWFYILFSKPRCSHLFMITRGILDGLRGISGKMQP